MIKNHYLMITLICGVLFFSSYFCSLKKRTDFLNKNKTNFIHKYTLTEEDSYYIKHDDFFTGINIGLLQKEKKEILIFGPSIDQDFFCFDLQNRKFIEPINPILKNKKIRIKDFYVLNEDSIVLKEASKRYRLHLMNSKGVIHETFNMGSYFDKIKYEPVPRAKIANPVFEYNDCIWFTGYTGGEFKDENDKNRPILINHNPDNGKTGSRLSFPPIYWKYNWAGLGFRHVYSAYNSAKNSVIFSFPASHKLYVYNLKNNQYNSYHAGSRYISKIPPFQKQNDWHGTLAKQDYITYFYTSHSYSGIYYDKYRNMYYRVAELKNKNFSYADRKTYWKPQMSIIILDDKFNYIGEKRIKGKFGPNSIFISKKGINILIRPHKNHTRMKIKLLTLKKL
jgi:hypothetical protein